MTRQTVTLTAAEQELWSAFATMRRRLDRALDLQLQRDSQISAPEYEILLALTEAPLGQLRIKDIAALVGWEKSRVSHQVARMEKRGLLNRTECQSDARGFWIGLTAEGDGIVERARRGHAEAIRRYFFDVLDSDDLDRLGALSNRIVDTIGCGAYEGSPEPDDEA